MTFRLYRALIVPLLILALLAGCQQNTLPTTAPVVVTPGFGTPEVEQAATLPPTRTPTVLAPTPTPSDVMGADPDGLNGIQIDFWHPWQGEPARSAQEAVDEFNRTNPWGIHVRTKAFYSTGALGDALVLAVETASSADGALPDLVSAPSEDLAAWAQGGDKILVDLADYIADERVGLSQAETAAFAPIFWQQDQSGDLRFGLPALRDARVIFYNQGWAKELGFNAPPQTPVEFKRQACAAAQQNNRAGVLDLFGTGGLLADSDPLTMLSWLSAFGAEPVPAKDGQPYAFDSEEAQAALEFLRGLVDDGCAWIARSGQPQEHFANRKAIFYTGTLADLAAQQGWQAQEKNVDAWMILPFPGEDGKPLVYSGGHSYGVLKSTPDEQLSAWLFARWMASPQIAAKLGEALPSLPVSSGASDLLNAKRDTFPWDQILPLADAARPAPALASWRQARRPLEDAAWQVYHLPADGLPEILEQLDATVEEILK